MSDMNAREARAKEYSGRVRSERRLRATLVLVVIEIALVALALVLVMKLYAG